MVKRTVTYSHLKVHCTDQHNFGYLSGDVGAAGRAGQRLAPHTPKLQKGKKTRKKNRNDPLLKGMSPLLSSQRLNSAGDPSSGLVEGTSVA